MEDERSASPQPDSSDSPKPQRPSGCPAEHINGHYEDARGETAVRFNQQLATEQTNGEEQGHNADQWEEISWSVQPLTGCAASLSFATVQWDLPESAPDAEEDTSLCVRKPQDYLSQLLSRTSKKENDLDVWVLPKTTVEMNGNHIEPCDAAEEEEPQKGEDLLHKLVDSSNGVTVRSESGGKSHLIALEAVSLTDILEETADVLQVKEEEEEPDILLTGKWESGERKLISFNGVHTCEGHEDEGEGTLLSTLKPLDPRAASAIRSEAPEEDSETKTREDLTVAAGHWNASSPLPNMTGKLTGDSDQTKVQDISTSVRPELSKVEVTHAGDPSDESALVGQKQPLTQTIVQAETSAGSTQSEQTETPEQNGSRLQAPHMSTKPTELQKTNESEAMKHLSSESEVTRKKVLRQMDPIAESAEQDGVQDGGALTNLGTVEPASHLMNGHKADRESARHLAERLFRLDGIQRVDVVRHLDKDTDFSRAVGEEYLRFFDFSGQALDHALRSFLKVVILIGETQERERVLQHFARRFHECNPESFSSSGAVLALTCALMLLNTDLHGQNVGKSMSSSKFVSNLDGMNDGENFSKDLLKTLFNSIKGSPLEWAIDEEELRCSVLGDEEAGEESALRSKSNPFQDLPHDKTAPEVKQGFLLRKIHADIDGKRTPWGKRGWRTFYGVLKGMVLYLKKDDYKREQQQQVNEEAVSVHHSLAEQAVDYTKKPHVFRLQTADWRVFLFQASSRMEMNSWISRINLVSALRSSPPFPAAVGSQRRFCRPILPASQSAHTLERQLQSAAGMLQSFQADLAHLQQNPPEGRKAKARELEEHRVRAQYLQHEMCRYQNYIYVLQSWKKVKKTEDGEVTAEDLSLFEKIISADLGSEDDEADGGLKKSHSSPSLELETAPPAAVKVRRNISERRTYRRPMVPRWNKEA